MNTDNKSYVSQSLPNITNNLDDLNNFDDKNNNNNCLCEICYESKQSIQLKCCNNTKKICDYCLECLTTPICPWCRKKLPDNLIKENMESKSLPDDYDSYFNHERQYLLINPDDPEYADSRVLRLALRNIRRNYYRTRINRNNNRSNSSRNINRQRRQNIRNSLNRITREYNEGRIVLDNDNNLGDDIDDTIFRMDL